MSMSAIWLLVLVIGLLFELATPAALVSIWFSVGALFAYLMAIFNLSTTFQIITFVLVSLISLATFRPMIQSWFKVKKTKTNADRYIGLQFVLENDLSPNQWYQQELQTETWSIQSQNDRIIPKGSLVEVVELSGVKLMVKLVKEN